MPHARTVRQIARLLAACELRVVFAESCTAGLACATLAKTPGISEHLCGSAVTYRNETKAEWLGVGRDVLAKPGPVSRITAEQMAAGVLRATPEADLSVSITGHLGPNAPGKLDGLVYVGLARREAGNVVPLPVRKLKLKTASRLSRQQEAAGEFLAALLSRLKTEAQEIERILPMADWRELRDGSVDAVCLETAERDDAGLSSGVIFPGSFDPLHDGHRRMTEAAREICGAAVEFELSIDNIDKPPLRRSEAAQRIAALSQQGPVWLTRAAAFADKARIFPGATFIVGIDTLLRIADPVYYGGSRRARNAALAVFAAQDGRLLCFGRTIDGRFLTPADVDLPPPLKDRCAEVDETRFRVDASSTEIRAAK
jgi:PncC family amidohydrolase